MNKKRFYTLLVLSFLLLFIWNRVDKYSFVENEYRNLYFLLEKNQFIDYSFDKFIENIFIKTLELMELNKELNVNKPYNVNNINIYIINYSDVIRNDKVLKKTSLGFKDALILAKNNFLTLPPNVILIDNFFLSSLILESHNELAYFVSLLRGDATPGELTHTENAVRVNGIRTHHRLTNLEDYLLNYDSSVIVKDARELANLTTNPKVFDNIAEWIANAMEKVGEKNIDIENIKKIFSLTEKDKRYFEGFIFSFMIPILTHEIAHIKQDSFGAYNLFSLSTTLSYYINKFSQDVEDEADKEAIKYTKQYFDQLYEENDKNFESHFGLHIQQLTGFLGYFRDLVLFNTFHNFRGLSAKDILTTIIPKGIPELKPEEKKLSLISFERVKMAYMNNVELPILTESEFKEIYSKLRESGSSLTHKHLLFRMEPIVQMIESYLSNHISYGNVVVLEPYLKYLKSINKKELMQLFDVQMIKEGTGLTFKQVTAGIEELFVFEKAVNYKKNLAKVGFAKSGNCFLEIVGPEDNIIKAKLIIRLNDNSGKVLIDNVLIYNLFVNNCSPLYKPDESTDYFKSLSSKSLLLLKSGYSPFFIEEDVNNIIQFRTLNFSPYFVIEFKNKINIFSGHYRLLE